MWFLLLGILNGWSVANVLCGCDWISIFSQLRKCFLFSLMTPWSRLNVFFTGKHLSLFVVWLISVIEHVRMTTHTCQPHVPVFMRMKNRLGSSGKCYLLNCVIQMKIHGTKTWNVDLLSYIHLFDSMPKPRSISVSNKNKGLGLHVPILLFGNIYGFVLQHKQLVCIHVIFFLFKRLAVRVFYNIWCFAMRIVLTMLLSLRETKTEGNKGFQRVVVVYFKCGHG